MFFNKSIFLEKVVLNVFLVVGKVKEGIVYLLFSNENVKSRLWYERMLLCDLFVWNSYSFKDYKCENCFVRNWMERNQFWEIFIIYLFCGKFFFLVFK